MAEQKIEHPAPWNSYAAINPLTDELYKQKLQERKSKHREDSKNIYKRGEGRKWGISSSKGTDVQS